MRIDVNDSFQIGMPFEYPKHNYKIFEQFFFEKFNEITIELERIYIPIFWTSIYVSRNFGKGDLSDIQNVIDELPRNKKYFTIVQYDDNILNDLEELDIIIFSMGGYGKYKNKAYVIPLNCQTPPNSTVESKKDIFASFCGRKTHKIREKLFLEYGKKEDYTIMENIEYSYFRNIMSRSVFSLCPRGYGMTSFRICESLQSNSIPVYIYNELFVPFADLYDFENYGVLIHETEIDEMDSILKKFTNRDISRMLKNGRDAYIKLYDFDGCFSNIIEVLKK